MQNSGIDQELRKELERDDRENFENDLNGQACALFSISESLKETSKRQGDYELQGFGEIVHLVSCKLSELAKTYRDIHCV